MHKEYLILQVIVAERIRWSSYKLLSSYIAHDNILRYLYHIKNSFNKLMPEKNIYPLYNLLSETPPALPGKLSHNVAKRTIF